MTKAPGVGKTDPQTACRLLGLPPELRNQIYEYALYVGKVRIVKITIWKLPRPSHSVLALLRTCRQIRNEAATIFYEINNLAIGGYECRDSEHQLGRFVREVSPAKLNRVKNISVTCWRFPDVLLEDLKQVTAFTGLRTLEFTFINGLGRHSFVERVLALTGGDVKQWVDKVKQLLRSMPHIERIRLMCRPRRYRGRHHRARQYHPGQYLHIQAQERLSAVLREVEKELQDMIDQGRLGTSTEQPIIVD